MSSRTDEEIRNQKLILGVTTTLLVLCYFLYFLRILSRKLLKTPLWIDDWFMLFALVGYYAQHVFQSDIQVVCLHRNEYTQLCRLVCCKMLSRIILNKFTTGVAYGSGVHRYHLQASEYRSFQIVPLPLLPLAFAG